MKLTKMAALRCLGFRAAGNTAIVLFAYPFYAIDRVVGWIANAATVLCAAAASPAVIFYDWCVKRHSAIRRAALQEQER